MITVQVINENTGKPCKGKRVSVSVKGNWFPGGFVGKGYTNNNGEFHVDVKPTQGTIYVDGTTQYEGYLSGREVIYI